MFNSLEIIKLSTNKVKTMRDLWFSESENNHQMNTGFPSENVLNLALTGVKSQLQVFFNSPDAFEQLDQVFDITDPKAADLLIKNGVTGNFENIPNLQILPDTAMNGSQGAFSNNKDTIYLAESLVQADILGIQETLIEELGHKFDTLLNPGGDTSGDEGELFKNIVLGLPVSEPELLRIQTENDFGTVVVDNQVIAVEQSYNTTVSSSPGFTKNRGGWTDNNNFPRLTGDVNGDGRADIVGFGASDVFVSFGNSNGTFGAPIASSPGFTKNVGRWTDNNNFPRLLADVNGDKRADIVGFSASNVFVSFGNSNGTFGAPIASSPGFTKNVGRWTDNNNFPRLTGDVNGDGRADIVGFGASNVFVSSGNSNGTFGTPIAYSPGLTKNVGDWTDNNNYPRVAGDVNNDGKADLIGFGASDVFASLAGAVTPPPLDYYPELSSLSETQWDRQSGDNNQFEQYPYGGGGDQRGKTDDRIEQIYTDLSKAIFGSRIPMTAGYAYDQSYYNGVVIKGTTGWWHAGLDIGANNEATIKAPIGGTVKWTSGSGDGNIFVGINSDDGRQWVYGHLKSKDGLSLGKRINTGETVGIVGALNHLHLEVENGLAYGNTDGAMKNQETLLSVTVSPLMAYWKWRNQ
jgi:hypothetical protein